MVHKLPPGKQFLLKVVSSVILQTYPYSSSNTKENIKPVIADSADEEPFDDEDYTPSIDPEEDEDETDEKPQQ